MKVKRSIDIRKEIIKTSKSLFSSHGYAEVSMNQIAKSLELTKPALYYYFKSKSHLYEVVVDHTIADIEKLLDESLKKETAEEKIKDFIKSYLKYTLDGENTINSWMLQVNDMDVKFTKNISAFRDRVYVLINPVIEEILKSKGKDSIDVDSFAPLFFAMLNGVLLESSLHDERTDIDELTEQIYDILF